MNDFINQVKKLAAPQTGDSTSIPAAKNPNTVDEPLRLQQVVTEEISLHPGMRIVLHTDPLSPGADRFRYLRVCLRELWKTGKLRTLLITSALPQDGKSTVSLNLATALAEGGKRSVLLVEADLHAPSLSQQLGLHTSVGLADCLENGANPLSAIRRLSPLNWYILPAGRTTSHPGELLHTEAMPALMQKFAATFDWVLVDSPPVIPVTDAVSLARQTNATLLVVKEGRTPREAVEKTIALIGKQRVLGVVLNGTDGLEQLYSGYYSYYRYANDMRAPLNGVVQPGPKPPLPFRHSTTNPQID